MRSRSLAAALVLAGSLVGSFASTAAAGLQVTGTTWGWDKSTQSTTAGGTGPLGQYPSLAVNQQIQVIFSGSLDKGSITPSSVVVESVPASELQPLGLVSSLPGGLVAPVTLKVQGNTLIIAPAVLFTSSGISFGFAPLAFYRIALKKTIGGSGGNLKTTYIRFRTTDAVIDPNPGPPQQDVLLIDSEKGQKTLKPTGPVSLESSFDKTTTTPAPGIRIKFKEVVLPSSVLNPANGFSPTVHVDLDEDGLGSTTNDRQTIPGVFKLQNTSSKSTLVWTPKLSAIPQGSLYLVTIDPLVEDLVGNSVFKATGDIGKKTLYAFSTKTGNPVPLPLIVEEFDDQTFFDATASSADWGESVAGHLVNGAGGGTAADGAFSAGGPTVMLPTAQFDPDLGHDVPRVYNFSTFVVPNGVTVFATGPFALDLRATGPITINGTLDVSGAGGTVISENQLTPGAGGDDALGGGAGAVGGSMTLGPPNFVPSISNNGFASIGYANSAVSTRGLSGSINSVADFVAGVTIGNQFGPGDIATLAATLPGERIQSNTGTGSSDPNASPGGQINHNHPTFQITAFAGPGNVTIVSNLTSPVYFGPYTQPGLDLYAFPPPPITKVGDPVVFGDMRGHDGDALGFAGSGGAGSEPMTVAQGPVTQARSGGGGGGGGRAAGLDGEDSPVFGTTTGTAGGAGGQGALTATLVSSTATTLNFSGTPFTGLSLGPGVDPDLNPAFVIFPDVTKNAVFEIQSNTASQITIKPVQLVQQTDADLNSDDVLNLSDVGGLAPGATSRIEPGLHRGGAGGGGSGVHCAGSSKFSSPPNLTLPKWTPGVGGGAGGGSAVLESADRITIPVGGRILARGGAGGRTSGPLSVSASGGGGGGGGTVVLRSADVATFAVKVDGAVDVSGGTGGVGFVDGGTGGAGRVRFEALEGNLDASTFASTVLPNAPGATELGFFIPGLSPSVGQSDFYASGGLSVSYTDFEVLYSANVDGVPTNGLSFDLADLLAGDVAPFEITFNDAEINQVGEVDPGSIDLNFVENPSSLHGAFIRFRVVLEATKTIDGTTFDNVRIDRVTITAEN